MPTGRSIETKDFRIRVSEAPAWSALFKRNTTWTGGDGIYAIPLSGCESPGHARQTRHLFVFGDSFIGRVDMQTGERRDFSMVYNTLALLDGGQPEPNRLRFIWDKNEDGSAAAAFSPSTPEAANAQESWYWLQDGLALNGHIYLMPMLVKRDPEGPPGFQFQDFGVCIIKIPLGEEGPDLTHQQQMDTPFFHINSERKLYFGAAFMPLTERAGAPDPDGYIYIYGRYQSPEDEEIKLAVARVAESDFEDFTRWRFWDGTKWTNEISATLPLGRGGPELSVTPVAEGPLKNKFLLVSMQVERELYIRIGESPVGPFGPRVDIYRTREPDLGKGIYTYNAKAHPSLSPTEQWLISYNVNSRDWQSLIRNSDIYRPRFIWLHFEAI